MRSPTNKIFEFLIAAIFVIFGVLWVAEHSKHLQDLKQQASSTTLRAIV